MPDAVLNGEARLSGGSPPPKSFISTLFWLSAIGGVEDFLRKVYDPSSPSYRHFVAVPEFTARFGPSQEDYDALIVFAKASGFKMFSGSRDSMDMQFTATVANIERAFM